MIDIRLDPILFRWGPLVVGWHGLLQLAGSLAGYVFIVREGRRRGFDRAVLDELVLLLIVSGFLGARLLHVLLHWPDYAAQPLKILAVYEGGLTGNGLLAGALVAGIAYTRWKRLPFWKLADIAALGWVAGQAVGRAGCTIAGDIWGAPTHGSWGLVYWHPDASIPPYLRGVALFPVPVVLQTWSIGALALLLFLRKHLRRPGTLFLVGMVAYSLGRFLASLWQPGEKLLMEMTQTQVISLAIALAGLLLLPLFWVRTRPEPRAEPGSDESDKLPAKSDVAAREPGADPPSGAVQSDD